MTTTDGTAPDSTATRGFAILRGGDLPATDPILLIASVLGYLNALASIGRGHHTVTVHAHPCIWR